MTNNDQSEPTRDPIPISRESREGLVEELQWWLGQQYGDTAIMRFLRLVVEQRNYIASEQDLISILNDAYYRFEGTEPLPEESDDGDVSEFEGTLDDAIIELLDEHLEEPDDYERAIHFVITVSPEMGDPDALQFRGDERVELVRRGASRFCTIWDSKNDILRHANALNEDFCDPHLSANDVMDIVDREWARRDLEEIAHISWRSSSALVVSDRDYTDTDNERRFLTRFGHLVKFCPTIGRDGLFYAYNNGKWGVDTLSIAPTYIRMSYAETVYRMDGEIMELSISDEERDKKRLKKLLRAKDRLKSAAAIDAMKRLLKANKDITVEPNIYDTDPMLFNLKNGTLDLNTFELRDHAPVDLITKQANVSYDPEATCPKWDRFLEEVIPDAETRGFLQRWMGYCLTGMTGEDKFVILHGSGANGKSVFLNVLDTIFGDYAVVTEMDAFLDSKSDKSDVYRAMMQGARFVQASEVKNKHTRFNEGMVKQLTGSDEVVARMLYGHPYSYKPTYKIVVALNHPPKVDDETESMWRRLLRIPFDVTIPPENRNPNLQRELLEEGAGILNWCIRGLREYMRIGLSIPMVVIEATLEYARETDVFGQFVEEVLEIDSKNHDYVAFNTNLLAAYDQWCEENGFKSDMNTMRLGKRMANLKIKGKKVNLESYRAKTKRGYLGVRIPPEYDGVKGQQKFK